MRILLVTDTYFPVISGVVTVVHSLGESLSAKGNTVAVIAPAGKDKTKINTKSRSFSLYTVPSIRNPIRSDHFIPTPHFMRVYTIMKDFSPHLVHIHIPGLLGIMTIMVATKMRLPIVVTSHGVPGFVSSYFPTLGQLRSRFDALIWVYFRWFYNQSTHILAPSTFIRNALVAHGVTKKISIIPMWIDSSKSIKNKSAAVQALRIQWHIPKNVFVFLYLGRVEQDKNLMTLMTAYRALKKKKTVRTPFLLIVGRGKAMDQLQAFIDTHHLSDIRIITTILTEKQKSDIYTLADTFVMPGPYEAQSIVTLEAIFHKLPVILANAGALPEIARRFPKQSTIFEANNPLTLTQRMTHAIRKNKNIMRNNMRKTNFYDKNRIIKKYISLYRSLIK